MELWAIELSEFDIQYCSRTAVKGQVIADFITEFTNMEGQGAEEHPQWSVHMDRSSNRQADGAGIVIRSPEGDKIKCMVCLNFLTTNNKVKYEALVAGFDLAKVAGATSLIVYYDCQVVTSQVNCDYEFKGEWMNKYLKQVRKWVEDNLHAKFVQIQRKENKQVDRLAKAALAEHMLISSKLLFFVQLLPMIAGMVLQEIGPEGN